MSEFRSHEGLEALPLADRFKNVLDTLLLDAHGTNPKIVSASFVETSDAIATGTDQFVIEDYHKSSASKRTWPYTTISRNSYSEPAVYTVHDFLPDSEFDVNSMKDASLRPTMASTYCFDNGRVMTARILPTEEYQQMLKNTPGYRPRDYKKYNEASPEEIEFMIDRLSSPTFQPRPHKVGFLGRQTVRAWYALKENRAFAREHTPRVMMIPLFPSVLLHIRDKDRKG